MTFSEAKALFESQQLPLCETHYRQFQIYLETLVETNRYMTRQRSGRSIFWTAQCCCARFPSP